MSVSTEDQSRMTAAPRDGLAPLEVVARAVAGVGVVVVMGLYIVVSPLIALGTGLAQIITEVRDTMVRPRPFVGARHGFPFLDRAASVERDEETGADQGPAEA
jgi:hypothetical protein